MNCLDRPEARTAGEAITSRRSVLAFLPEPVSRETVRRLYSTLGIAGGDTARMRAQLSGNFCASTHRWG